MKGSDRKLLEIFASLDERRQAALMEFAGYLASRAPGRKKPALKPRPVTRPENETVVKAIRRLTSSYPMLDRRKLLNETSRCMAEHSLKGRPAQEVISELESVFALSYRKLKDAKIKPGA